MRVDQIIQGVELLGSVAVLVPYAASQFRRMDPSRLPYTLLNLIGSGTLAIIAIILRQWGFLLLEGAWALVSLWSATRLLRRKSTGSRDGPAPRPPGAGRHRGRRR